MKVRNGFVSNSSSSSYVLSFGPNVNIYDHIVEGYHGGDSTRVECIGIEDVAEELKSWYGIGSGYEPNEYITKEEFYKGKEREFIKFSGLVSKIVKECDAGNNVAIVTVGYHDEDSSLSGGGINTIESFG